MWDVDAEGSPIIRRSIVLLGYKFVIALDREVNRARRDAEGREEQYSPASCAERP